MTQNETAMHQMSDAISTASKIKNGQINPQQVLQSIVSQNPQAQKIMQLLQLHNGNYEAVVKQMANEQGIDLNQMISIYNQLCNL